ncbi:MAG: hypothetical protein HY094_09430 [Candidatus Melainabacteria bacterium]|nr:hypothetical protein [Candidatus Melainabacteria bacterium]
MDQNTNPNLEKILRIAYFSTLLILILLFMSTNTVNINYAKLLNEGRTSSYYDISTKEFPYIFKVSDKLQGTGSILLSVEDSKIKGTATGIGKVCQCNIDFQTKIDGDFNGSNGSINIAVDGVGDPVGILPPGKVTFQGPLKGSLTDKKLTLTGKVNIKGSLASYAGFKNIEDIIIEIPDSTLAKTFKQIQNKRSLASL